jgi:DNA-binding IclR family transcriptional regulator
VERSVDQGAAEPGRPVTARELDLLGAFDTAHRRMTLTELAARAGLPMATAHRLVGDLAGWGALARRPDGAYEVGHRLWTLGLLAPVQGELQDVAASFLQDLYAATGDTVHRAVRDGSRALYAERLSGRASVPVVSQVGGRLPLHTTGVVKVLLAHAPPDVARQVLGSLTRETRHSVVQPGRMARELSEVRRRGYARTVEEMTLGACSVAVPVHEADGTVVAAVGVVVPSTRRDLVRLVPALQVAAHGITRHLGQFH